MRSLLGLTLGLVLGWTAIVTAQTVSILPTDPLECTFTQAAPSLAEAQAMRVGLVVDALPEVIKPHTCTGTTSPYACRFVTSAPPAPGWPVGPHTFTYRTGNVEVDATVSWGTPVAHTFTVTPPKKGAPATPTNSILRKLLNAIAHALSFRWIG